MNIFYVEHYEDFSHKVMFEEYVEMIPERLHNNREYLSLLYLLSSNKDIRAHVEDVFDFDELEIKPYSYARHGWQTSGSLRITRMAYNLFNGNKLNGVEEDDEYYSEDGYSVNDLFDSNNLDLFIQALTIRYSTDMKTKELMNRWKDSE